MPQGQRGLRGLGPTELAKELFARATAEHSTPREIGFSVGVGVFCACTPLVGLHTWLALAAATLLRLNRLWAALGSRVPLFLWVSFGEIQLAHRLRTGAWVSLMPRDVLSQGRTLLSDWIVGTAIVGTALAAFAGLVAYACAKRWSRAADGKVAEPALEIVSSNTPDGLPPPSSGSPPSAPPRPTP